MNNSIEHYLLFFPLALVLVTLSILFTLIFVTFFGKVFWKDNIKSSLKALLPFFGILLTTYFIFASFWDVLIESKWGLFTYWDQMPWSGFYLLSHDQPVYKLNETPVDLAPGVSLLTLDVIWFGMLIGMYAVSVLITYLLFWRKNHKYSKYAILTSLILLLVGFLKGWGYRGGML